MSDRDTEVQDCVQALEQLADGAREVWPEGSAALDEIRKRLDRVRAGSPQGLTAEEAQRLLNRVDPDDMDRLPPCSVDERAYSKFRALAGGGKGSGYAIDETGEGESQIAHNEGGKGEGQEPKFEYQSGWGKEGGNVSGGGDGNQKQWRDGGESEQRTEDDVLRAQVLDLMARFTLSSSLVEKYELAAEVVLTVRNVAPPSTEGEGQER